MRMQLKLLMYFTILIAIRSRTIDAQSLPGCPDKCGIVTIPYPFGTIEGCYLSEVYQVNCTKLQIWNTSFKLLDISLNDHTLRGSLPMAYRCHHKNSKPTSREPRIKLSRFPILGKVNLLTTVGCDARANMKVIDSEDYITGCLSMTGCNMLTKGLCFGMGCSQVPVPYELTSFRIHTQRNTNTSSGNWGFNKCTYGFIVEKDRYMFLETDLDNMLNRSFPVVFGWSVGNTSCEEAQKNGGSYVCKENSVCIDSTDHFIQGYQGYRCTCSQGYQGNPYIPNGCQDINECEGSEHHCIHRCVNTNGSYKCTCPFGQHGDGRKNGCSYSLWFILALATASVVLSLILYGGLKQRQTMKSRERFFKKNGGLILQKLLFESKQSSQTAKIFSAGILEKATRILTEKSDVYSFGMVLVELLTGRKVYSHDGTESELGLAIYFVSSFERGSLIEVLDAKVKEDGVDDRIKKIAKLAKECVELEGKKRPNMRRVKDELKQINESYLKSSLISNKVNYADHDQLFFF
ncbi:hypothetical protein QVD17_01234 [Tagetes erecta]|uniref:EGF-like domain-containing protein n=1 Tax=Tagetes erecta TaxID=13708 RepID=A0AAD8L4L2_TARER|nr:hypothetical protein QVD17_01234 [Tagetes erecta]